MVNTPDSPVFPLRRRLKVMAGHSQFKNIMHRKGAQDARRAKVFTKLIRELTTAARMGQPDPNTNPRMRAATQAARAANMPKDTVERAITRGAGNDAADNYAEIGRAHVCTPVTTAQIVCRL